LGNHTHKIATRSPEAQKFFDQGLTLLYGFNRYEALRSFRKAAELDPDALMPQWGMAMALGPHINMDLDGDVQMVQSCQATQAGLALRERAPARERAYIDTVASRCPDYQPAGYQKVMHDLMQQYPDDFDAAVLYAESLMIPVRWKWWKPDGTPAEGTEEALRVLESVMRQYPNHPGANHFYIHAAEMSPTPERAIPSAQRLMGIVPAAGHLVHMPGHIWLLLGDFGLAADLNEHAAQRDREYMKSTGVSASSYAGYYVHNLHFVAYGRSMQGRMRDAIRSAEVMADAAAPLVQEMPMMVDPFVASLVFSLVRFQRWEELLTLASPSEQLLSATALWRFGRGVALAATGKRQAALQEKQAFKVACEKVPADWIWLNNKASGVLQVASAVFDAKLAENHEASISHWERAVTLQDALSYDEPPPWFYPIRESLGGALLRAGQLDKAVAVFREGLRRSPRNGRLLFGLMKGLEAQQNHDAAELVRRQFEEAWQESDVVLRVADL
jgi:tetratricopeptide (TPR) repeat protein